MPRLGRLRSRWHCSCGSTDCRETAAGVGEKCPVQLSASRGGDAGMAEALEGGRTPRLRARKAALEEERRAGSEMEGVLVEGHTPNGMNGMEGARVVQRGRTRGAAPGGDRRRRYGEASWSIAGCCVSDIHNVDVRSWSAGAGNWRCPGAVVGGRIKAAAGPLAD